MIEDLPGIVEMRHLVGLAGHRADDVGQGHGTERVVLDQLVEIVHVGLVVQTVMERDRPRRDHGVERGVRIGQGREREGHSVSPFGVQVRAQSRARPAQHLEAGGVRRNPRDRPASTRGLALRGKTPPRSGL